MATAPSLHSPRRHRSLPGGFFFSFFLSVIVLANWRLFLTGLWKIPVIKFKSDKKDVACNCSNFVYYIYQKTRTSAMLRFVPFILHPLSIWKPVLLNIACDQTTCFPTAFQNWVGMWEWQNGMLMEGFTEYYYPVLHTSYWLSPYSSHTIIPEHDLCLLTSASRCRRHSVKANRIASIGWLRNDKDSKSTPYISVARKRTKHMHLSGGNWIDWYSRVHLYKVSSIETTWY